MAKKQYEGVVVSQAGGIIKFNVNDLFFTHEKVLCETAGIATNTVLVNKLRLGGQAMACDYLFSNGQGMLIPYFENNRLTAVEGAFVFNSGDTRRFFIESSGRFLFEDWGDEETAGRFHYTLSIIGLLMMSDITIEERLQDMKENVDSGNKISNEVVEFNHHIWNIFKQGYPRNIEAVLAEPSFFKELVEEARKTYEPTLYGNGDLSVVPMQTAVYSASVTIPSSETESEEETAEEEEKEDKRLSTLPKKDIIFLRDFLSGAMRVESTLFTEERQTLIPDIGQFSGDFIFSHDHVRQLRKIRPRIESAVARIKSGDLVARVKDVINLIFQGKAGVGKSAFARVIAEGYGLPIQLVECGQYDEEDKYNEQTKVLAGKFSKVTSMALESMREGGVLVFEEADLPADGVLKGAINNRLEAPFTTVVEKGGKEVLEPRHALSIMIATSNVTDTGVDMESALLSRFGKKFRMKDPSEDEFIARLMLNGAPKEAAKWVYELFVRISALLRGSDLHREDILNEHFTFRACRDCLDDALIEGITPQEAVEDDFICCIAERDPKAAESILATLQTDRDFCNPPSCMCN